MSKFIRVSDLEKWMDEHFLINILLKLKHALINNELPQIDPAEIAKKLKRKYEKNLNEQYEQGLIYMAKKEVLSDLLKALKGKK